MIELLEANPLLLLFFVVAIGYLLGQIRVGGNSMGVAAVLFVGLAFGALDPALQMPQIILDLGLVLFVYTIGLANGPGFFSKFRREGLREVLFIVAIMTLPALLLLGIHLALDLTPATTVGIFTGMSNNTPALASVLDLIGQRGGAETAASEAVVGFSVVYPLGVLGRMLVLAVVLRLWPVGFAAEAYRLRHQYPIARDLQYRTIEITQERVMERPLRQLRRENEWDVLFGRLYRGDETSLISNDTQFQPNDKIVVAGTPEALDEVEAAFGQRAAEDLRHDHNVYDSRRLFVSNPDIAGKRLSTLNLREKHGAIVSHVRRGDVELLARGDTVLEWGDRIRVLAPREEIPELVTLFGDSFAQLSHVNLLTVGLGIAVGWLLGLIPITLPGGITFQLGLAGGPLLVALVLGALRRTGPILWKMPYSANLTLRQLGLILLLAAVGVRSGTAFLQAFTSGAGWLIFGLGFGLIVVTTLLALWLGHRLLRIPFSLLLGMISPQPAVLEYAEDQAQNPLPGIGYMLMFPFAIIINVILAQVLLIILQNYFAG
ncbi:aspartate:alanine exchanger family transporter [Candidatus Leptofilum sp.]|uniref:aspartate:alanine exchanger family transporter n=1 Tax=Candidatus Leptofilum sp. TaxID=3241576 RepID=UPI003B5B1159